MKEPIEENIEVDQEGKFECEVGPNRPNLSIPPSFKQVRPNENCDNPCNFVPCSLLDSIHHNNDQMREILDLDSESLFEDEFEKAFQTWCVGKTCGLSVKNDDDITQAILEDRR